MRKFEQMLHIFDQAKRGHIARMLLSRDPAEQQAALAAMEHQIGYIRQMKQAAEAGKVSTGALLNAQGTPVVTQMNQPDEF